MKIFWWILWIITTLYIRIWIINNSFKKRKNKSKFSILIFILSLILVSFLYFYKDILGLIGLENLYFSNNISLSTISLFIFYCLSFLILISISLWNLKNKTNLRFIITAILLFLWIWIWWIISWINTLIMFYLISCYAEEILKFSVWQNTLIKGETDSLEKTDLILFAIIAWLWFSVIENIFYIIALSLWWEWNYFLTIWRWIFTTLLHIAATWLIAFFIIKKDKHRLKYWLKCLIWIICWFWLHWLYNISLVYKYKIITILILIICYFILSYLLFNSDSLYSEKDKIEQPNKSRT